ncbi:MAG: hypothetical protein J6T16_03225, partial [Opitutales bacterium]|nr:hypothetical protein [Opitutales bacterium]
MKSFKFLFVQYLLLSITIAWACDCGRRSPPPGRMSSFSPGTLLLKETFGYVPGHGQLAELTIEESSNIFELTSPSALKFKINGRADKFIHRLNLYAANDKIDSKNLKIGDWIEFPALKIEISDLTLNKKYASGYSLKGYTPNSKNKKHKINLAYQIDIIGGYKRSIDSTEYIPESEVKDGDLYLLEILHKDGNTKDILQRHKIYRFTDKEGKLSDGLWYYDDGFKKTKIR